MINNLVNKTVLIDKIYFIYLYILYFRRKDTVFFRNAQKKDKKNANKMQKMLYNINLKL